MFPGFIAVTGFVIALFLSSSSNADEAKQQTFKTLVARGFKVVATAVTPAEVQPDKVPVIVVTLQQETAVAVCTMSFGNWESMSKLALEDTASVCDVRFY